MGSKSFFKILTIPAAKQCQGSVIMLHGSGGTGPIARWGIKFALDEELVFPHLRIHYLTAPLRPYTLNGGFNQNVWFDRIDLREDCPEHYESISEMAGKLSQFISKEIEEGIPPNKIILGGFSMGGAMSLHLGYTFHPELAGIFCMSSFLYKKSKVYESLSKSSKQLPPLFMAHGDADDLVSFSWGRATFDKLTELGVKGVFHSLPHVEHEHSKEEILSLKQWIMDLVPPNAN
ncbi:Lysophospholipase-like protein 1 [Armadillidium nasatum]|uniref:palmitoyl-protein hydrolase n=1 Tax=Armadillidium nasatum TaxID=96803 RepID=A0A5N5SLX0_9CRUS|nr:Lysophospholipase-like protein 1 [Armadillidium nasatum]